MLQMSHSVAELCKNKKKHKGNVLHYCIFFLSLKNFSARMNVIVYMNRWDAKNLQIWMKKRESVLNTHFWLIVPIVYSRWFTPIIRGASEIIIMMLPVLVVPFQKRRNRELYVHRRQEQIYNKKTVRHFMMIVAVKCQIALK